MIDFASAIHRTSCWFTPRRGRSSAHDGPTRHGARGGYRRLDHKRTEQESEGAARWIEAKADSAGDRKQTHTVAVAAAAAFGPKKATRAPPPSPSVQGNKFQRPPQTTPPYDDLISAYCPLARRSPMYLGRARFECESEARKSEVRL